MSSKTKIVVLRMKEIIYTAIFIGLGLLLITLFLIMFRPSREADSVSSPEASSVYTPGVYTSAVAAGNRNINVSVTVDSAKITSIDFVSLDEAVTTMYPLMQPALKELSSQILDSQSLENLSFSSEKKYTQTVLLNAIQSAVEKAKN